MTGLTEDDLIDEDNQTNLWSSDQKEGDQMKTTWPMEDDWATQNPTKLTKLN